MFGNVSNKVTINPDDWNDEIGFAKGDRSNNVTPNINTYGDVLD